MKNKQICTVFAFLLVQIVALTAYSQAAEKRTELDRLANQAKGIVIKRDDWGIAHVHGKTDADAVFGAIYAQAEDDFNRIETNYLNSMGRLAEAEGEAAIWQDLRMKLFIDPVEIKRQYETSPQWLKKLMAAWADGLNYYLATHTNVKPRVITHFEPWMALTFSEGSIGGDIESVDLRQLRAFYDNAKKTTAEREKPDYTREPTGSNGFAIAPSNTKNKRALLLINPHTSFFFRSELHMSSDEGLNAYGASTWGQFFIYQGFNDYCGWMHTSSSVDAIDEYRETVEKKNDHYTYKYGKEKRPLIERVITVPYKTATGMNERTFTAYRTHHGPVVRTENGKWITVALMEEPVKALEQSYNRTKATNLKEFKQVMELHGNSSNNTIYADRDGNIAYFHANFIPRRDPKFDWTQPVDGSDPKTDWQGLLSVDESPNLIDPASGWLYNSNNYPWSNAGESSLKQANYPKYVDNGVETARGRHAIRVLSGTKDFTLESLNTVAYDSYLTWFDKPLPALLKAYYGLKAGDPVRIKLAGQVRVLQAWDQRWGTDSVATSLAVFWGDILVRTASGEARRSNLSLEDFLATRATAEQLLSALASASDKLTEDFGTWETPWGQINRFQRLTDDIVHPFDDNAPSIPVGFTSGNFGSLASFGARPYRGSKKWYGTGGNSFVAVVEFGKTIRAKAVTAGGESGDPRSKHFNDQAQRYSTGALRDVYFYPAQLKGHIEREYHPGN